MDLLGEDGPPAAAPEAAPAGGASLASGLPCSLCFAVTLERCNAGCGAIVPVCGACAARGKVCVFCADRVHFESRGASAPAAATPADEPEAPSPAARDAVGDDFDNQPGSDRMDSQERDYDDHDGHVNQVPSRCKGSAVYGKPADDDLEDARETSGDRFDDPWKQGTTISGQTLLMTVRSRAIEFVDCQTWADLNVQGVKVKREFTLGGIAAVVLLLLLVLLLGTGGSESPQVALSTPTPVQAYEPEEADAVPEEVAPEEDVAQVAEPSAAAAFTQNRFSVASAGAFTCPPESTCITTAERCEEAVNAMGKTWMGQQKEQGDTMISNPLMRCYIIGHSGVYKHFAMGTKHVTAALLCEPGSDTCIDQKKVSEETKIQKKRDKQRNRFR